MPQLDFDALWDYQHPDQTEATFRQLLARTEYSRDRSYYLQLLTQIARTQGLQRNFAGAHTTLDSVKDLLYPHTFKNAPAGAGAAHSFEHKEIVTPDLVVPTIRYLLERGRVFNSSGQPTEALTWFRQAWELARGQDAEAFFAVDAAHMLAIAASSFEEKIAWNQAALQHAEASSDEQARDWCGSLYNNLGWAYHDQGAYQSALEYFQQALAWQQEHGAAREVRIARWCVGRTLRSLQRTAEALALQQELLAEWEKSGEQQDGYVSEEIAECLFALGRVAESQAYFAQAYALLSQDRWLVAQESQRLQRLKQMGQVSEQVSDDQ